MNDILRQFGVSTNATQSTLHQKGDEMKMEPLNSQHDQSELMRGQNVLLLLPALHRDQFGRM